MMIRAIAVIFTTVALSFATSARADCTVAEDAKRSIDAVNRELESARDFTNELTEAFQKEVDRRGWSMEDRQRILASLLSDPGYRELVREVEEAKRRMAAMPEVAAHLADEQEPTKACAAAETLLRLMPSIRESVARQFAFLLEFYQNAK